LRVTGKVNGFANSSVYATNFNGVTLAIVAAVNDNNKFGVYADSLIRALSVTAAGFKYTPGARTRRGSPRTSK
jgi:hypothetical protein